MNDQVQNTSAGAGPENGSGWSIDPDAALPKLTLIGLSMVGALAVGLLVVVVALLGLMPGNTTADMEIPPENQVLSEIRARDAARLEEFAVVDQEKDLYRIPISMAMELVAGDPSVLGKVIGEELPPVDPNADPMVAKGQEAFIKYTCNACHSLDGTRLVGPSIKGMYGKTENLMGGGTALVDDAYIIESIKDPMVKVVDTYPPAMVVAIPPTDEDIAAIIEFIKSYKD